MNQSGPHPLGIILLASSEQTRWNHHFNQNDPFNRNIEISQTPWVGASLSSFRSQNLLLRLDNMEAAS